MMEDLLKRVEAVFANGRHYFDYENSLEMYEIIEALTEQNQKLVEAINSMRAKNDPFVAHTYENGYSAALRRGEWKPIADAPKNTLLILTLDFKSVYCGALDNDDGMWYDGGWGVPEPTHFMKLPEPPESSE